MINNDIIYNVRTIRRNPHGKGKGIFLQGNNGR